MSQLARKRIRLPVDTSKFDGWQDALTSSSAKIWNGSPTQFEFGLQYSADKFIDDFSNVLELTLQIKAIGANDGVPAENAAPLLSKTITEFDGSVTAATWKDFTKQSALVQLSGAEAKLGAGKKWMILVASIDGEPDPVTLRVGAIDVVGDGYENGVGALPTPAESYLNSAQSDARYARPGVTTARYLAGVSGLTGGTASDLDAVATVDLLAGHLVDVILTDLGRKSYVLRAGTTAEESPGIIRPDDYDADDNAKFWESV